MQEKVIQNYAPQRGRLAVKPNVSDVYGFVGFQTQFTLCVNFFYISTYTIDRLMAVNTAADAAASRRIYALAFFARSRHQRQRHHQRAQRPECDGTGRKVQNAQSPIKSTATRGAGSIPSTSGT